MHEERAVMDLSKNEREREKRRPLQLNSTLAERELESIHGLTKVCVQGCVAERRRDHPT